jgi:hypothetical protein
VFVLRLIFYISSGALFERGAVIESFVNYFVLAACHFWLDVSDDYFAVCGLCVMNIGKCILQNTSCWFSGARFSGCFSGCFCSMLLK